MPNRPQWAEAIRMFVIDEVIDEDKYGFPEDGADDSKHDKIERAVLDTMCSIWGHEIIDDQCMIPAHRFCAYCGLREGVIRGQEASAAEAGSPPAAGQG